MADRDRNPLDNDRGFGQRPARAKNPMGKARKPGNPYITTLDPRTGWMYEVLKTYQVNGSKPYARAFCNVHGFATEMGDVYIADIGQMVVNYDRDVFASAALAEKALYGDGTPSAPDLL